MRKIEPKKLEKNWLLWILLSHTRDTFLRIIMRVLHDFDVYPMEAGVLFVVHESSPPYPSPADISRWMFRESQTISSLLNRMERRGLIRKVRDDKRKNGIRIKPTPRGTAIYKKTVGREGLSKALSFLSDEDEQILIKYLDRVRRAGLKELNINDYFVYKY